MKAGSATDAEAFDTALGTCAIRDGELVIDRTDPADLTRRARLRRSVATNVGHRPRAGLVWVVGFLLIAVFVDVLADRYRTNRASWPLVVGLALFGVAVVGGSVWFSARRVAGRGPRRSLGDGGIDLVRPRRVPLASITRVTVREVDLLVPRVAGTQCVVHYRRDGAGVATPLGFPAFMADQRAAARAACERHGIPVEA